MSRWAWHETPGPRKGYVIRKSDRLTPAQEERQDRERHEREMNWINGHDTKNGKLYEDSRACAYCGHSHPQRDMFWTGRRWLCVYCQAESTGSGAHGI